MPLVNAPVFGKLLTILGIRESVALTKVDLSRAVATVPTTGAIRAEVSEFRLFQLSNTEVGAATRSTDPRMAANWDNILLRGAEGATAVPADHDYQIVSLGATADAAITVAIRRRISPTTGASLQMLWIAASQSDDVSFGTPFQQTQSALWSPAGDPSLIQTHFSGAAVVTVTLGVISAPPGVLWPTP